MKMKKHICVLALLTLVVPILYAQEASLVALGGRVDQRGASRVLYRNTSTNNFIGGLVVTYGQPEWKAEYEELGLFDKMTKGQVWRMGSNFWSVLDTNVPLKIGDRDISVGSYYLGIHRSQDGADWSLAFMNPDAIREAKLDASEIAKATIDFTVPMQFSATSEVVENLVVALEYPKENPTDVTLKVAWGSLQLETSIDVIVID